MKKLKGSIVAKVLAALLIVLLVGVMIISAVGIGILGELEAYSGGIQHTLDKALNSICNDYSYDAMKKFAVEGKAPEDIYPGSGFCFIIKDRQGNVLYDGTNGRETIAASDAVIFTPYTNANDEISYYMRFDDSEPYMYNESDVARSVGALQETDTSVAAEAKASQKPTTTPATQREADTDSDEPDQDKSGELYTLNGFILKDYPADSRESLAVSGLTLAYNMRYSIFVIAFVALVAAVLLFVFLMCAAGHRAGTDEIVMSFLDRVPFDLFTVIAILLECALVALVGSAGTGEYLAAAVLLLCFCGVLFILVGLLWCMSLAVRIKLHSTIKSCICYKVLVWIWRCIKWLWSFFLELIKGLPLIKGAALIIAGILIVEFLYICAANGSTGKMLFGWFIERVALVGLTGYVLLCMKKLLKAGKEISSGNVNYAVDTTKMLGPLKEHGEDLNSITVGMNKAIGERMKSERFKTELITNVSHDIKTPLTSIINYVDLMEKEKPENPRMKEYLEVLSRQSERLKKLIDDLLEASKASTGNLPVNLQACELGVLIDQCVGEYVEKLQKAELELVVKKPEKPLMVMADGRHLWRIIDNLLNNVCKYAQKGTRVYLTLEQKEQKAIMTLRNISASMLNISGEELMERFVQGDASRNSEGSGLGLNIAKSLAELQGAELSISVDGDLFKVNLSFDLIQA